MVLRCLCWLSVLFVVASCGQQKIVRSRTAINSTGLLDMNQYQMGLILDDSSVVSDPNLFRYAFYSITKAANSGYPQQTGNYLILTFSDVNRCATPGKVCNHTDIVLATPSFGLITSGLYQYRSGDLYLDSNTTPILGNTGFLYYINYLSTCDNSNTFNGLCNSGTISSSTYRNFVLLNEAVTGDKAPLSGRVQLYPSNITQGSLSGSFTAYFCEPNIFDTVP